MGTPHRHPPRACTRIGGGTLSAPVVMYRARANRIDVHGAGPVTPWAQRLRLRLPIAIESPKLPIVCVCIKFLLLIIVPDLLYK